MSNLKILNRFFGGNKGERDAGADIDGNLLTAQGMPSGAEITRQGESWAMMATTATLAAVVVRPSTVAMFEIFNAYQSGGPSLIIDRVFYFNIVSTNVSESFSGWAQVSTPNRVAAAPTTGNFTVRGSTGRAYGGAVIGTETATVLDSGWFPWAESRWHTLGGVLPQGTAIGEVNGRLIVPPGASLGLQVVASLVTQKFTCGASWYEKVINYEA